MKSDFGIRKAEGVRISHRRTQTDTDGKEAMEFGKWKIKAKSRAEGKGERIKDRG